MKLIEKMMSEENSEGVETMRNIKFRTEICLGVFFLLVNIIFIIYLCISQEMHKSSKMAMALYNSEEMELIEKEDTLGAYDNSKKQLETERDSNYNNTATDNETKSEPNLEDSYEEKKKVYLTFDDGPSQNTEKILDILKKYDVKATFFVIGKEDEFSLSMYKRIVAEGHTLGMHSYSHDYHEIYRSKKAFSKDLKKIQNLLEDTTEQKLRYYRFPGGTSNTVSEMDMRNFVKVLNKKGLIYFDWNAMTGDASGKNLTKSQMIRNVLKDVEIHNTSVVLLHDAAGKDKTVEVLPALIKKLKKDAVLLPVDEKTSLIQHIKADSVK